MSATPVVRVVVLGRDASVRRAVRNALECKAEVELVAEVDGDVDGLAQLVSERPDVVVVEPAPPGAHGAGLLAALREQAPQARIVVLSGNEAGRGSTYHWDTGPVVHDVDLDHLTQLLGTVPAERPEAAIELPPDPSSVAAARRFVGATLDAWGLGEVVGSAVLVTSELVTNAWRHAGLGCRLRLARTDDLLRIEVADAGSATPAPRGVTDDDEEGRGLLIVSAISATWGLDPAPPGKVTWAELLLP